MEAKEDGLVRFIGVTGHGVTVAAQHLRSLQEYPFDSVLLPYNFPMWRNERYVADFEDAGCGLSRARRGHPNDQGHHPRPVG